MIPVSEAKKILDEHACSCKLHNGTESIPLTHAAGRVLAEDTRAVCDYPFFDNSAMDGFALCTDDVSDNAGDNAAMCIKGEAAAGDDIQTLARPHCMKIFTGAPVPRGADCVVPVEHCDVQHNTVVIKTPIKKYQHIRFKGESIREGNALVRAGTLLNHPILASLASFGISTVCAARKPKIAIGIAGNEIVVPPRSLGEHIHEHITLSGGKIYDTNGFLLEALCSHMGCDVQYVSYIEDTEESTMNFLEKSREACDVVLTCGGISMGNKDMLSLLVGQLPDSKTYIRKVAIKPGKPFTFAVMRHTHREVPLFCLPGNPLSVFITFLYFAAPYIYLATGANYALPCHNVPSPCDIHEDERARFLFIQYTNTERGITDVRVLKNQGSGNIFHLAEGKGALIVPENTAVKKGDILSIMPFDCMP